MAQKLFTLEDINSVRPSVPAALTYGEVKSALDLGAGVGRHALYLAKKGIRVTAVEARSEAIAALRELVRLQKLPVTVVRENVTAFEPKKKYDLVLSLMLAHFLPYPEQETVIKMMQDTTKKGGINVVSSYTNKNPKKTRPFLIKAGSLRKAYESAGWEILDVREHQTGPVAKPGEEKLRYWIEEVAARKLK